MLGICGNIYGKDITFVTETKRKTMKVTITTKAIKSKRTDVPNQSHLCFRLRDKDIDLKVRSSIEVLADY